jgi:hypothetical protein
MNLWSNFQLAGNYLEYSFHLHANTFLVMTLPSSLLVRSFCNYIWLRGWCVYWYLHHFSSLLSGGTSYILYERICSLAPVLFLCWLDAVLYWLRVDVEGRNDV